MFEITPPPRKNEGPSRRMICVHISRRLTLHNNYSWHNYILWGKETWPRVPAPRTPAENPAQEELLPHAWGRQSQLYHQEHYRQNRAKTIFHLWDIKAQSHLNIYVIIFSPCSFPHCKNINSFWELLITAPIMPTNVQWQMRCMSCSVLHSLLPCFLKEDALTNTICWLGH